MIDAVLFDLGDTIIDFGVGRREAELLFRQGAKLTYEDLRIRGVRCADGSELPSFAEYSRVHYRIMQRAYLWSKISRRDFSYETVLHRAACRIGLALTALERHRLARLWYRPINLAATVDPGVPRMLNQLRDAGTRLGIVSNTLVPGHCLDGHLDEEGLLEYFPVRVYSSQVGYRKPHPRIFEMALELIGVPASRTLFIGDLLRADVAGAKRMGMHTIWKPARQTLNNGLCPRPSRRHRADLVIPRVVHLPEALARFGWRAGGAKRQVQGVTLP